MSVTNPFFGRTVAPYEARICFSEDIQEFNAKINGPREGRSSRSKAKSGGDNDEEMKNGDEGEGEGEDEDDSPGPSRPRKVRT